jgi:RNA recognition motif-containing protein
MESEAEVEAAIQEFDGAEWMGRTLKVNKAKPCEEHKQSGSYARSY